MTPTIAGSRPGGLTAACWASMVSSAGTIHTLGHLYAAALRHATLPLRGAWCQCFTVCNEISRLRYDVVRQVIFFFSLSDAISSEVTAVFLDDDGKRQATCMAKS